MKVYNDVKPPMSILGASTKIRLDTGIFRYPSFVLQYMLNLVIHFYEK